MYLHMHTLDNITQFPSPLVLLMGQYIALTDHSIRNPYRACMPDDLEGVAIKVGVGVYILMVNVHVYTSGCIM